MINTRHADVGRHSRARKNDPPVSLGAFRQFFVATPLINQNLRFLFFTTKKQGHKIIPENGRKPVHSHPSTPFLEKVFQPKDAFLHKSPRFISLAGYKLISSRPRSQIHLPLSGGGAGRTYNPILHQGALSSSGHPFF